MGKEVMFDYSKAAGFVSAEEMANFKTTVMSAKETLLEKTGAGNDFLGWIDLPVDYDKLLRRQRKRFRMILTSCWW